MEKRLISVRKFAWYETLVKFPQVVLKKQLHKCDELLIRIT